MRGTGPFDALVEQRDGRSAVSLVGGEPRRTAQGVHPLGVVVWDQFQQLAQASPPLGEVASRGPERGEPVGQPQRGGRVLPVVPVQGHTEVVVLQFQQVEPIPGWPARRTGKVVGQTAELPGMGRADGGGVRHGAQPPSSELADGLQHRVARHRRGRYHKAQQAMVD